MHRYQLAALISRGRVVDCASGIGYGGPILAGNKNVCSYLGIDPSADAIEYAWKKFSTAKISYLVGTLENNACQTGSVDTFVMFETLEHTTDPQLALSQVRSKLSTGGLLIGSVPSKDYEDLCEKVYGPNPYHLHKFSFADIVNLLQCHFDTFKVFAAEFTLGTLFRSVGSVDVGGNVKDPCAGEIFLDSEQLSAVNGSLFFIAGERAVVDASFKLLGSSRKFFQSISKARLDQEEVRPLRIAFERSEEMIRQRDEAISAQTQMLEERWAAMRSMEEMITQRDEAIVAQAHMLKERWEAMRSMEEMITQRDEALQSMEKMISQRDATIAVKARLNTTLNVVVETASERLGHEYILSSILSTEGNPTPFRDMAFSLYLFTARLYENALQAGTQDLFFFAREGKLLKEMFDLYQSRKNSTIAIRTHYLQVSRRSTFLLSLGPLDQERFEILFRQYRRISIADFLKSLALDEHMLSLANALGVTLDDLMITSDDLPADLLFNRLLKLDAFRRLYEEERTTRSTAFERYLSNLVGGLIPNVLHVVDVGWKGSIQDNLFNWLNRVRGEAARIEGYYLGLVATGGMSERNTKNGLLFSNVGKISLGFHVFNETRSLFEVILHADHGSAQRYIFDADGNAKVIQDPFQEKYMIEEKVAPVAAQIMDSFGEILAVMANTPVTDGELLKLTLKRHARMVFNPSKKEVDWILSVSHVENFGVFEESRFGNSSKQSSFLKRIRFTWHLFHRRRLSELGFWPWLSIREHAIGGVNVIYRLFRLWQSRV